MDGAHGFAEFDIGGLQQLNHALAMALHLVVVGGPGALEL
jgi:hypothetical protein